MSETPWILEPPAGDLPAQDLRVAMDRARDWIAGYLRDVGEMQVMPPIAPGDVSARLPVAPPDSPEPLGACLDDFERVIAPNLTHWNHPGFLAYFAISGTAPGIVGETLAAAVNVNAMLWRTGPAPTELEERVCDWLRQMVGLPQGFRGHINDTASIGSMLALASARHRACGDDLIRRGLIGRSSAKPLTVYASEHAHSSIDKAMLTLGLGLDYLRKIPADDEFRMRPNALADAIRADRAAGLLPAAVVATLGTTSTTSLDPVSAIADLCARENLWLHVDAAYAGSAAICPELRAGFTGWERADSIVINPHKWLFTPVDCSVLLVRDVDALRRAFSVVPEYLRTPEEGATNLMDLGVQLGRRFRSLKLWFVIRAFGVRGLQQRVRYHCALAAQLADRLRATPGFRVCAPTPFSTVCFRHEPEGVAPEAAESLNERLLAAVNATGRVMLSHTKLNGRTVLRLAIGNIRTGAEHIRGAYEAIREGARRLAASDDTLRRQ